MKNEFTHLVKDKTDKDLMQIIKEPYQYQPDMVNAATYELAERGIDISEILLSRSEIFEHDDDALTAGKKANPAT